MKHRRGIAIILTLTLLLGLLPASALADERPSTDTFCSATGGQHSWRNWTTDYSASCTEDGARSRVCGRCGYRQTETIKKTGHSWGKWKTTVEATCTRQGEQTRKCSACGKTETRKTDKLAHTWGSWQTVQAATCTATGTQARTCKVCGEKQNETIAKLAHTWGEWTVITEPTDHSAGTRTRSCQVCGTEETQDFDPEGTLRRGDKGEAVKKLQEGLICYGVLTGSADGSFGPGTEAAVKAAQEAEGLTADGVAWPQTQVRLGHRFGEWETLQEMTDFTTGIRQRACSRCGHTETEETWPEPTYKRGDKGDGVKALQEKLNAAGYDCGTADGDFGGKTEAAVQALEAAHGVTADGIAWPGVQKWLGMSSRLALRNLSEDYRGLLLNVEQVSPAKELYAIGEEISFEWTLCDRTLEPIRYVTLVQSNYPESFDPDSSLYRTNCTYLEGEDTDLEPFDYDSEATLLAPFGAKIRGEFTWQMQPSIGLDDIVILRFAAIGEETVDGVTQDVVSNVITMEFRLDPLAPKEEEEEEEELELVEGAGLQLELLSVEDSQYLEGDHVKAELRLTNIDTDDLYSLSFSIPNEDMIEVEGWGQANTQGGQQYSKTLKAGESVNITYTMVISENTAGWNDRTVDVRGRFPGRPDEEVWAFATIHIPVKPSKVTIVSGNSSVEINSNDSALVLTPSEAMPLSGLSFIGGDEIMLDFTLRNTSQNEFLEEPRLICQYCKRDGTVMSEFASDIVLLDKRIGAKAGNQNGETAYSLSVPALGDGEAEGPRRREVG